MKKPHNIKLNETKKFNNLQEIQDFCDTYEHDPAEFEFIKVLTMKKVK